MPDQSSPITVDSGTNVLQSFSDATAGRSQQLFYLVQSTDSVGVSYVIVRDSGKSDPAFIQLDTESKDLDFDITINKPTIFAGIATIDVRIETFNGSGAATSAAFTFTLRHYDGTTETDIGAVTTETITDTAPTTHDYKLKFNVTRKLFGIGHTLRLNISGSNTLRSIKLHTDPTTAGNELKTWLPVVNLE